MFETWLVQIVHRYATKITTAYKQKIDKLDFFNFQKTPDLGKTINRVKGQVAVWEKEVFITHNRIKDVYSEFIRNPQSSLRKLNEKMDNINGPSSKDVPNKCKEKRHQELQIQE